MHDRRSTMSRLAGLLVVWLAMAAGGAVQAQAPGDLPQLPGLLPRSQQAVELAGPQRAWFALTVNIRGPESGESADPNPFTDYRLNVTFAQGDRRLTVPGYYAADGNAANTGADSGPIWQARFVPDQPGPWTYHVSFRTGPSIAIDSAPDAGRPVEPDGATGQFTVQPHDVRAEGFHSAGRLQYVGQHYLRFAQSGDYFLKGGADSPENFLAYVDFDQTIGKHRYQPHERDWRPGDPTWAGARGKAIIGALNYLSRMGMNSVYFLTMNVKGDGKDVWPWTGTDQRSRFDCSKLDQWNIVFDHMDRRGIMMHVVTQETENDQLLDEGELGPQRRLYYRELIARFAGHLAVVWNLGEENTNTNAQRKAFASYIRNLDPYDHPIVVHTYPNRYDQVYRPLLGFEHFEGTSLQTNQAQRQVSLWRGASARAGRRWVVTLDEIGPAGTGVKPDSVDPTHDAVRGKHLWPALMAGGAGVEWYFGYSYAHNDLNCEDWRSRENLWRMTDHALDFFQSHLPFWAMTPADRLLRKASKGQVLALEGRVYAVYLPEPDGDAEIQLPEGRYELRWYNPRTGGPLLRGHKAEVVGPGWVELGPPPIDRDADWVVYLKAPGPLKVSHDATPAADPAEHAPAPDAPAAPGRVRNFTLIDASTDLPVAGYLGMAGQVTIDLAKLPSRQLNVRANTSGSVSSVRFDLNRRRGFAEERVRPFALAGDSDGNYNAWKPEPGDYRITATPAGGAPTTLQLRVVDSGAGP